MLPENEISEFCSIVRTAITESNHPQKTFATKTHIHLGLESSLRAINGRRFSCVFVSLSLRPSHVIRLIASSVAAKVPTAPLYAQPKLEELTYELFGVRALILVLPLELDAISPKLTKWVTERQKPVKQQQRLAILPAKPNKKPKKKVEAEESKEIPTKPSVFQVEPLQKEWTGDYISCSDGAVLQLDQVDVHTETQQLGAALSNLVMKVQSTAEPVQKNTKTKEIIEKVPISDEGMEVEADEDEFLPADLSDYRPLTVHQIRANPDKKPKKKRNKNKQTANK